MPNLAGLNNSNASGEISEDAWERSDLDQVATGCELAANFIGLTTGAAVSRGGFYRRGAPKHQDRPRRLFPWNRSDGDGLVVEFGHLYGRIWTASGAPIMDPSNPSVPYEFVHGYNDADLPGLRLKQVGDIGFISSRDGLLNTQLRRLSNASWVFGVQQNANGPWFAENADETKALTLQDMGAGVIKITATGVGWAGGGPFTPQHVLSQVLIRPPGGYPGLLTWAPNTVKAAGNSVISVGRVYQTAAGGTTGNTPPNHEAGSVSDGGVLWEFVHDGATAFRIFQYNSPTEVLATNLGTPPFDLTVGPVATPNWSFQAFSDVAGRPTALTAVREERLVMAATPAYPDKVWLTRTAGFTPDTADWKPGLGTGLVVDDDAVELTLGDIRARIVWLIDSVNLIAGSTEAAWVISGPTLEDPITPSGVKARRISGHGCADVMPVLVQGPPPVILCAARGATTLIELVLGAGADESGGRDLSILSQHVFGVGVADMAWSKPDNNLWLLLKDQTLACLTYHREHGVIGVRRQPLGGGWLAESLCTSPDLNGQDRLHVAALRTKAGVGVQRAHFVLAPRSDGVFMDACEYYEGSPVNAVAGLSHLDGEEVVILADGAEVSGVVVSGGQAVLPGGATASSIFVGHRMMRRFKTLPFDPNRNGLPLQNKSRPVQASVSLKCVHAVVRAEPQDEPDSRTIPATEVIQRRPGDTVPVLRRKRSRVMLGGGADADVRVIVESDKPYDLQVFAIRPVFETAR